MKYNRQELELLYNELQKRQREFNKKKDHLYKQLEEMKQRMEKEKIIGHSRRIRDVEKDSKKITSIAIHQNNQNIIHELQMEAKDEGFFLSKENIMNMGLQSLHKEVSMKGVSISDLFLQYLDKK